jgi:hypothetical protein
MAKATVNGLKRLRRPEEVAKTRGLTISQVLPHVKVEPTTEEPTPEAAPEEPSGEG